MDFEVINYGSVWSIRALSDAAKEFALENFATEGWQGQPTYFYGDWRPMSNLIDQLVSEGWKIA